MKLSNYKPFFRWWLFFSLIIVGVACLIHWDMFARINAGDVTKISFLIFALFVIFTLYVGIETYRICRAGEKYYKERMKIAWFMSDNFLTLGMIGTVIGFIYMLSTAFVDIDITNLSNMKLAIVCMSTGMSTALYTTASGLICSLFLKLQLFNAEHGVEDGKKISQ